MKRSILINCGDLVRENFLRFLLCFVAILFCEVTSAQQITSDEGRMEVGISRVDITPEGPIRMAGYNRKKGSKGVGDRPGHPFDNALPRLWAKALAFGNDIHGPSILITVDLIGIPGHITAKVAERLSKKVGLDPDQLAVCATHTHGGPEVGSLLNLTLYYSDPPVTSKELVRIAHYQDQLADKLEQVALAALKDRSPALVSWGKGEVEFAINRRGIENGKWVEQRDAPDGVVDHSLPLLRITDLQGKLRAVFVNYAAHPTTFGGNIIHGDWPGEAQRLIEAGHPDATAMVAMGCGADANPELQGKMEYTTFHGKAIADEVDRLLATSLHPLPAPPLGHLKHVELPFAHVPDVQDLAYQIEQKGPKGYNASLFLDRLVRGEEIPISISYPVQTWTFGDELAMVFLGGEVVADYSLRLKEELGDEYIWINGYSNDVSFYVPSRRILREGGYEAEGNMYYYNQPSRFAEEVEDLIIETVHDQLAKKKNKDFNLISSDPSNNIEWGTGVALYSFRRFSFTNAIKEAEKAGVQYVEGFTHHKLGKEFNNNTITSLSREDRLKMKQIMADKGIEMTSLYVNGAKNFKNASDWKLYFDIAKEFEMKYLVSEPLKNQLDIVDSLAGLYNIKLAIHQHSKEYGSDYWHPDLLLAAIKNRPHLAACPDLSHWARSGLNPVKCLEKLEGHILGIHLNDVDSFNSNADYVAAGIGVINMERVVNELKHQNFKGMILVEFSRHNDVVPTLKYFNGLVNE